MQLGVPDPGGSTGELVEAALFCEVVHFSAIA
jgi:hypothetical protein